MPLRPSTTDGSPMRRRSRAWAGWHGGCPHRRLEMTIQPDDPELHAEEARLRYISDDVPGVRRRRAGKGFTYLGPSGRRITDAERIAWFKGLAIPPAWTDVW